MTILCRGIFTIMIILTFSSKSVSESIVGDNRGKYGGICGPLSCQLFSDMNLRGGYIEIEQP